MYIGRLTGAFALCTGPQASLAKTARRCHHPISSMSVDFTSSTLSNDFFTAMQSTVSAIANPSVRPSVRPSVCLSVVTCWHRVKMRAWR